MKPIKITITHYQRSAYASIQYGKNPTKYNYYLNTELEKFNLEVTRLNELGAIITIDNRDI